MYESLGAHVNWASNGDIFEDFVGFDSKAEITKFISLLVNKDIG